MANFTLDQTGQEIQDILDTVGNNQATQGQVLTADGQGGASWQNVSGGKLYLHRIYFSGNQNRKFNQVRFSIQCTRQSVFSSFNDFVSYFADKYQFMPILSNEQMMYASIGSSYIALYYYTTTAVLEQDNSITITTTRNQESTYAGNAGTIYDTVSEI